MRPLAIVDIDGVVADVRHRLHHLRRKPKDWDAFFAAADDDGVHAEGVELVQVLAEKHDIVFLTGRPRRLLADTTRWLEQHGFHAPRVIMRPDGDRRAAAIVKVELLDVLAGDRDIAVIVDDDPLVLRAMQAAGYTTYEATWEQRQADSELDLRVAQEVEGRT